MKHPFSLVFLTPVTSCQDGSVRVGAAMPAGRRNGLNPLAIAGLVNVRADPSETYRLSKDHSS